MGILTRTDTPGRSRLAAAVLALVALAVPATQAAAGGCVLAELDEPFLLPDGSFHPAGQIRICLSPYSPAADLHTIVTGNGDGGFFLGRRAESEQDARDARPELVFGRSRSRSLTLLAYRVPARDGVTIHWLETPGSRRADASVADNFERDDVVLVAATAR